MYTTAYKSSCEMHVILGSSIPHSSSGYSAGLGGSVGLGSITQSLMPSRLRAAVSCEMPRRSSTRMSSKVSFPNRVARECCLAE